MNCFYDYNGRNLPHFFLVASNLKLIDIVGVLLLYKFMEYSILNSCFMNPRTIDIQTISDRIAEFGFGDLISSCYNSKKMYEEYSKLRTISSDTFLVSPISIYKNNTNRNKIEQTCFRKISQFYGDGPVSGMVFMTMSELISNFYSHSNDQSRSIIVAYGNKSFVEIACADAGDGIIKTLRHKYPSKSELDVLKSALKKGVSSKPESFHMGYGMWMLDETVRLNQGRLVVYSERSYYERVSSTTSCVSAPFWKGTIVYLKLNLTNPVNVKDIIKKPSKLKINFK